MSEEDGEHQQLGEADGDQKQLGEEDSEQQQLGGGGGEQTHWRWETALRRQNSRLQFQKLPTVLSDVWLSINHNFLVKLRKRLFIWQLS